MVEFRFLPSLMALALVAVALAGCSSSGKEPDQLPPADFDDLGLEATATTGIIRGIVVDDAIRPVAGADVGIVLQDGTARNTTSAADGAFGFDKLPPGTYFLTTHKAGFLSAQANADVVVGVAEPPIVKILLVADPSLVPYVTSLVYDAFIACSFTLVLVSFAACGLAPEETNNAFLVSYDADKPVDWIQVEAIWESTQPLGSDLSLGITDFSGGAQVGVNGTVGPSPIHVTVNATKALQHNFGINNSIVIRLFSTAVQGTDLVPQEVVHDAWAANGYPVYNSTGLDPTVDGAFGTVGLMNPLGESCIRWVTLFAACMGAGGFGAVIEQKVTVYTHLFYGFTPPVDWRFSAADVPQPPA